MGRCKHIPRTTSGLNKKSITNVAAAPFQRDPGRRQGGGSPYDTGKSS